MTGNIVFYSTESHNVQSNAGAFLTMVQSMGDLRRNWLP